MARSEVDHIDVLKMDIEGGEGEVIGDNFPFGLVKNIVYEVHGGAESTLDVLRRHGYSTEVNQYSVGIARLK